MSALKLSVFIIKLKYLLIFNVNKIYILNILFNNKIFYELN